MMTNVISGPFRLVLVAALGVLSLVTTARAASDDDVVFIPLGDPISAGVAHFSSSLRQPEWVSGRPTIKVLVVYTSDAAKPPPDVAYFRVDQSVDCSTRSVTNKNYAAWDKKDRALQATTMPEAASVQVPPNLLGDGWDEVCPSQRPPGILLPQPNQGGPATLQGVANAVTRARERQEMILLAQRRSTRGHFYPMTYIGEPFNTQILIDGDGVSKIDGGLRLPELVISGQDALKPQPYSRRDLLVDCEAQTYREESKSGFDSNGTLLSVSGEMPGVIRIRPRSPKTSPLSRLATCFRPHRAARSMERLQRLRLRFQRRRPPVLVDAMSVTVLTVTSPTGSPSPVEKMKMTGWSQKISDQHGAGA